MDISYELYKVFYYVASTLSFSQASQELFISQSAVSQAIKTLEKKLNQTLFIRSTKKVELTAEGETLFRHIEPAVHLIQRGEMELTAPSGMGGQLRIGASDTICRYFLVPYLQRFHTQFPDVHIRVTNQTSLGCARLLETGQVDLIVSNYPNAYLREGQKIIVIREFQDVFTANPAFFDLRSQTISLDELSTYPILTLTRKTTTSEFLHAYFQQRGWNLNPEVELTSNDLLIDLARIGLGIAFVPDFMIAPEDPELYILKTKEKLPSRQLVLSYNTSLPASPASQEFIRFFT